MKRGAGLRCAGWVSDDQKWIHCSREEFSGQAKFHPGSQTYSHAAAGRCPCGETHGAAAAEWRPPSSRSSGRASGPPADIRQIGDTDRAEVVATYEYRALDGILLYQVLRTEPKSFRQRQPDGKGGWLWTMKGQPTTLYRIPQLIAALQAGDPVYIAEGEKDVGALEAAGCVATCNTGGAGKWRGELSAAFRHADHCSIRIVQDRDDPGRQHAMDVWESVGAELGEGSTVVVVEGLEGKDAADHLGAGRSVDELVQVWPIPEDLLDRDPASFKRHMLRKALETPKNVLAIVEDDPEQREQDRDRHQIFHTGLVAAPFFTQWRGAVAISGEPSTGKSYLAISTAVDAALAGWDVYYLSAEMHDSLIRDRAARAVASHSMSRMDWRSPVRRTQAINEARRVALPDTWTHIDVGIGVRIEMIVEMLADHVTHRPTMVVFDSLSSFVDSMDDGSSGDSFGMADLRHVTRWLVGARKLTHGHICFLLLSEINKEGRAKGRFLDHRCDTAISVTTDAEEATHKRVHISKNWWGPQGSLGDFLLDWELGRLVHIDDED